VRVRVWGVWGVCGVWRALFGKAITPTTLHLLAPRRHLHICGHAFFLLVLIGCDDASLNKQAGCCRNHGGRCAAVRAAGGEDEVGGAVGPHGAAPPVTPLSCKGEFGVLSQRKKKVILHV
jgi:hypothetical protein